MSSISFHAIAHLRIVCSRSVCKSWSFQRTIGTWYFIWSKEQHKQHWSLWKRRKLCLLFMDPWMAKFFAINTAGYLYRITWTLAAVFRSSLAHDFPMGISNDYCPMYIFICLAVVVSISWCLSISRQFHLQMLFFLMIATPAVACAGSTEPHFGN